MRLTQTTKKVLAGDMLLVTSTLLAAFSAPASWRGWSLLCLLQFPFIFAAVWLFVLD